MNYEAIIFDIDGTLIDYDYSQYQALDKLLDMIPWNNSERPVTKEVFEYWYKEKNEFYDRPDSEKYLSNPVLVNFNLWNLLSPFEITHNLILFILNKHSSTSG